MLRPPYCEEGLEERQGAPRSHQVGTKVNETRQQGNAGDSVGLIAGCVSLHVCYHGVSPLRVGTVLDTYLTCTVRLCAFFKKNEVYFIDSSVYVVSTRLKRTVSSTNLERGECVGGCLYIGA